MSSKKDLHTYLDALRTEWNDRPLEQTRTAMLMVISVLKGFVDTMHDNYSNDEIDRLIHERLKEFDSMVAKRDENYIQISLQVQEQHSKRLRLIEKQLKMKKASTPP